MFILYAISKLPLSFLYLISDFLFFILFYVAKYRRRVVYINLKNAFPEKSPSEIHVIAKAFYKHLADIIIETLKALSISSQELIKRVHIQNLELLLNHLDHHQSIIVMASHQANWEWLQLVHAAKINYAVDAVYKPLHSKFSDDLMLAIRTRFGSFPLPMTKLPREIIQRKQITRIIAMVADQTPAPEHAYWTQFLHQDTPFFTGAAKIAQRTGYPILFAGMRRLSRGHYEVYFRSISTSSGTFADTEQIIEKYVQEVAKAIRDRPSEWLWSHKRWKHKRQIEAN